MIRCFRYRLYPTRAQERTFRTWLDLTRELYNAGLQERRDAWEKQRISVSEFDQFRELKEVRQIRPDVAAIPTVVLRGALSRLDKAFNNFFRRCREPGAAPGYPRFKGPGAFTSILIEDFSYLGRRVPLIVAGNKRVMLPRAGKVKVELHRPIEGKPKGLRIVFDNDRWFVSFYCTDVPPKYLPEAKTDVGIDLGLTTLVATSDGQFFENPKTLQNARLVIERAQRRLSRRKIGGKRRAKAKRIFARKHARATNIRREIHIKIARELVITYAKIYIEKLTILKLSRSMLGKHVHDAAWGYFLHWLHTKAESAGREVIEVNPYGTSTKCSNCDTQVRKTLKDRTHCCPTCGLVLDRDTNAAKNILQLGRSLQGDAPLVGGRRRSAEAKSRSLGNS